MLEFNTESMPKGLMFMLGSMSKWLYGDSPTEPSKFEEPLRQLKDEIASSAPKIFQDAIQRYLGGETHWSTIELAPSQTLEKETLKEEENRLTELKNGFSEKELDEIIRKTSELQALQATEDSPETCATIPSLKRSDLRKETTEYPIPVTENHNDSGVAGSS